MDHNNEHQSSHTNTPGHSDTDLSRTTYYDAYVNHVQTDGITPEEFEANQRRLRTMLELNEIGLHTYMQRQQQMVREGLEAQ